MTTPVSSQFVPLRFHVWVKAWLEVVCGVVNILTFTLWQPQWDFQFMVWISKREFLRRNS